MHLLGKKTGLGLILKTFKFYFLIFNYEYNIHPLHSNYSQNCYNYELQTLLGSVCSLALFSFGFLCERVTPDFGLRMKPAQGFAIWFQRHVWSKSLIWKISFITCPSITASPSAPRAGFTYEQTCALYKHRQRDKSPPLRVLLCFWGKGHTSVRGES